MKHFARTAVRNHEGKFLLIHTIKEGRNRWELPGGKVKHLEPPHSAAARELWEETGLQPSGHLESITEVEHAYLDGEHWHGHFYYCPSYTGNPHVMEPDKADAVGWFSLQQMLILPMVPLLAVEVCRRVAIPRIVCLCGSTKFYQEFQKANYQETGKGHIVLTVGFFMHSPQVVHGETLGIKSPEQKIMLDELHKRKIDLCDEVLVLDIGQYMGASTRSEIEYAEKIGKKIRYISKEGWTL